MSISCAKRALLYLGRRKGKTAGLFLVVFVIAALLFCSFGVFQTSEALAKSARSSLGGAIYIRPHVQAVPADGGVEVDEAPFSVSQETIDDVLSLGGFAACNPVNYGFVKSDELEFVPGYGHSAQSNMGKVVALRSSALAPGFVDEGEAVIEGRHITAGDAGAVVVSEVLARENGLAVGDVIPLAPALLEMSDGEFVDGAPNGGPVVVAEVVGIFRPGVESAPESPTPSRAENKMYASLDVLEGTGQSRAGVYTGEVDFYVQDPASLAALAREVEGLSSIDRDACIVRTNDFQYEKVSSRLAETSGLAFALIAAISGAGALILGLMLVMRARSRMREAGILLAVGIPKRSIAAQMLCETLLVAVLAVGAGWAVSLLAAAPVGRALFAGVPAPVLSDQMIAAGVSATIPDGGGLLLGAGAAAALGASQVVVVAAATLAAAAAILRAEPRDILTRLS